MEEPLELCPVDRTLMHWIDSFTDHLRLRNYTPQYVRDVGHKLRRFAGWLQKNAELTTLERLQPEHLRKWNSHILGIVNRKGMPCKPPYIYRHLVCIRQWLKYLAERGVVPLSLGEVVQMIRIPDHLPGSVLTHAQARKLLMAVPTNTPWGYGCRAILEVLYSSGLRAGEFIRLKLSDVDYENKTLLITGKGNKQRVVPVGRTAMRYLETYVKAVRPFFAKPGKDHLFLSKGGVALCHHKLTDCIHYAARCAKFDQRVTCHTFRRSCATELIRNGANIYHVKELLGHEKFDTMRHYAMLTIVDLKKTHEKCHPREKEE